MTGESGASPITIIRSSGLRRASSPSSPVMVLPSSSGAPTFAAAAEAKTSPGRGASSSPGGTGAVRPGIGAYRTTVNCCPSMYRSAARRIAPASSMVTRCGASHASAVARCCVVCRAPSTMVTTSAPTRHAAAASAATTDPRSMTRSQRAATSESCVTTTAEAPEARAAPSMTSTTAADVRESSEPVGSSANARTGTPCRSRCGAVRCAPRRSSP